MLLLAKQQSYSNKSHMHAVQADNILAACAEGWLPAGFEMRDSGRVANMEQHLKCHDASRKNRRPHAILLFLPITALASETECSAVSDAFHRVGVVDLGKSGHMTLPEISVNALTATARSCWLAKMDRACCTVPLWLLSHVHHLTLYPGLSL